MYFIGNFTHISDQESKIEQDRRHGDFSMMVEAEAVDAALDKFRQRLVRFKDATTFFEGQCTIYITQILEFDQIPQKEAVVLNFKSYAGDPMMPFISCVVPSEQSNACSIHEWQNNRPMTEGRKDNVFLTFD